MRIDRFNDRKHRELSSRSGERYSLSAVLSGESGEGVFISHEIVPPGRRSSGAHYHTETEEIVYVLEGELTAVEGESEAPLGRGDALVLEASSGLPHYLENRSHAEAHALVIRRVTAAPDAVMAPPGKTS